MESMLSELDKTLRLPDRLRGELQRVHGEIVDPQELPSRLRGKLVISVGDVVSHTLLSMGIEPKLVVVDYRTKRSEVVFDTIREFGDEVIRVRNPPGTITPELWSAVKRGIESERKVRVDVDGEEDLAVIPVVLLAPLGAIVIYGMPNTGLVVLEITDEDKKNAARIMQEMEVLAWS